MNKIKPVWFSSLYRNYFLSKTQWSLPRAEYVLLFTELDDVKTEGSTSCKGLFDKQCPFVYNSEKWKHIIFILFKQNQSIGTAANGFLQISL